MAITRAHRRAVRTGQRGRPPLRVTEGLSLTQTIKHRDKRGQSLGVEVRATIGAAVERPALVHSERLDGVLRDGPAGMPDAQDAGLRFGPAGLGRGLCPSRPEERRPRRSWPPPVALRQLGRRLPAPPTSSTLRSSPPVSIGTSSKTQYIVSLTPRPLIMQ